MSRLNRQLVKGVTEGLTIERCDDLGPGGAPHRFDIQGFDLTNNTFAEHGDPIDRTAIVFQDGSVPEKGANGVTLEALLAVAENRLQGFQSGPFPCSENAEALGHISAALDALHRRTEDRMARRVEGKHAT